MESLTGPAPLFSYQTEWCVSIHRLGETCPVQQKSKPSPFVVVQLLSHVRFFATPWTAACHAHLSFTIFQSFLRFMSIESVILSALLPLSTFACSLSQHQGLSLWSHLAAVEQSADDWESGSRATQGARTQSLSRVRLYATPWTVATRLLCPWEFPGKNTGVGCHFLLQGIFPTQGWNPCLFHCQADSFTTVPPGKANTHQCSNSSSASDLLWDLEPVTSTLWASVSSPIKGDFSTSWECCRNSMRYWVLKLNNERWIKSYCSFCYSQNRKC